MGGLDSCIRDDTAGFGIRAAGRCGGRIMIRIRMRMRITISIAIGFGLGWGVD